MKGSSDRLVYRLQSERSTSRFRLKSVLQTLSFAAGTLCVPLASLADVSLPVVFTENMILQRDQPIRIWGDATAGETVSIKLDEHAASATADTDGKWKTELAALPIGGAHTLTVSGKNSITFTNVLMGDVWFVGGSWGLMGFPLSWAGNSEYEISQAGNYPKIRLFQFSPALPFEPRKDHEEHWQVCAPPPASQFSGIGYMFGRILHVETGVPIGLIQAAENDRVVSWMSPEGLRASPDLKLPAETWNKGMTRFAKRLNQFVTDAEEWEKAGDPKRPPPSPPQDPRANPDDGALYPASAYSRFIARIAPFGIRGVIWTSAGTCGRDGQDTQFRYPLVDLVRDWRRQWGKDDLPFVCTQLYSPVPGFYERNALLFEEQAKILQLPNTGIVPICDLQSAEGDLNDPELARRFALQILAISYGRKAGGFGPMFKSMKVDHGKLLVRFDHAPGLRSARGRPLHGFEIAGEAGNFTSANATIAGDAEGLYVQVWNDGVPSPAMVRYDWAYTAEPANLINRDHIPALPFRADVRPQGAK